MKKLSTVILAFIFSMSIANADCEKEKTVEDKVFEQMEKGAPNYKNQEFCTNLSNTENINYNSCRKLQNNYEDQNRGR